MSDNTRNTSIESPTSRVPESTPAQQEAADVMSTPSATITAGLSQINEGWKTIYNVGKLSANYPYPDTTVVVGSADRGTKTTEDSRREATVGKDPKETNTKADNLANETEVLAKTGFTPMAGLKTDEAGKTYKSYLPPKTKDWENAPEVRYYHDDNHPEEDRLSIKPANPENKPINDATKPGYGRAYKEYPDHKNLPYTDISLYPSHSRVSISLENPALIGLKDIKTGAKDGALVYGDDDKPKSLVFSAKLAETADKIHLTEMDKAWGYDSLGAYSALVEAEFQKEGKHSSETNTVTHDLKVIAKSDTLYKKIDAATFSDLAKGARNISDLTILWNAIKDQPFK